MEKIAAIHTKGHYSAAVIHKSTIYIAGQLPIDYEAGKTLPEGGIQEQTLVALNNLARVLERSGSSVSRVLKTTVYISDVAYWPLVNEVYAAFFGAHKPARSIVPVSPLHHGCLVEIEAIACID